MPMVSRGLYRWLFRGGATLSDTADRLSHVWTCGLLLVLAVVISWKHGYSEPVSCWCPSEFTASMVINTHVKAWQANNILYMEDVIKANMTFPDEYHGFPVLSEDIPDDDFGHLYTTTFYQWIPLILCFQALLFKLPNFLMYIAPGISGINFDRISRLTTGYDYLPLNDRTTLARQTARYFRAWFRQLPGVTPIPCKFLAFLWLSVKIMYVINAITQLVLLDSYLNVEEVNNVTSSSYGDVIETNWQNQNASFWRQSPAFPRHVLLEYEIYHLRNAQRYRIQCDLPGNNFAEYAYMFLWVWLAFVVVVTIGSLLMWIVNVSVPQLRRR